MNVTRIPVINISRLERSETLRDLDCACRNWGAFQVLGHGVPAGVINTLQHAMREFFAQPPAEKRRIQRTRDNPWGFYDQELTRNTRDWKEIFDFGPADNGSLAPQWPTALPHFRPAVLAYYAACEVLAFRLLGAVAATLGAAEAALSRHFHHRHTSFVRLNYYPVCPRPEAPAEAVTPESGHLGLNQHTDAGALTILLQDRQPGLEVYRDGLWKLVEPIEGALVINLGDIIQVWSNDRYRAPLHRVLANDGASRYSAPFFFNPSYDSGYRPLPGTVDVRHPARYREINWGEFRRLRTLGDYGDYGEEIQISHFRI